MSKKDSSASVVTLFGATIAVLALAVVYKDRARVGAAIASSTTSEVGSGVPTAAVAQQKATRGWYDVRRGAAGYSPVIGAFGALSIPSVFLLFNTEVVQKASEAHIVFAVGALVISLMGTMFGAIGLAAIGAERVATANLSGAIMALSVGITAGFAGMFAGIDTVAVLFVPGAAWLFALLLGMTGAVGAFLTSAAIADSTGLGPDNDSSLLLRPRWPRSRSVGTLHTYLAAGVACLPILATGTLRIVGVEIPLTLTGAGVFVALSAALVLASLVYSVARAAHRDDNRQRGLQPLEAYFLTITSGAYAAVMLLLLP